MVLKKRKYRVSPAQWALKSHSVPFNKSTLIKNHSVRVNTGKHPGTGTLGGE